MNIALSSGEKTVSPLGTDKQPSFVIPTIRESLGNSQSLTFLSTRTELSLILYSKSLALPLAKFSTSKASDTVTILNIS